MSDRLSKELEGIGFSEKESKVYLAALEIGPSTAQTIAAKATVNRPTTYIAIESLVKRGLMSSITKGKKRFFVAESPEKIFSMFEDERRDLETREALVSNIMDDLMVLSSGSKDRPDVLFFEGVHGIERLKENVVKLKGKPVDEFVSLDLAHEAFPVSEKDHGKLFFENDIGRSIYTSQSGIVLPRYAFNKRVERRRVSYERYPFDGNIAICGDLVSIINYKPKLIGIQIHQENIAGVFRQMFQLVWDSLSPSHGG